MRESYTIYCKRNTVSVDMRTTSEENKSGTRKVRHVAPQL